MTSLAPEPRSAHCPECRRPNVLVVAVTSTVASLYCLACDHLFAVDIDPMANDLWIDQTPLIPPKLSPRVVSIHQTLPTS